VKRTGSLQVHKDSKTTSNRYFRNLNLLGGNSSDSRLNISDKSRTISGTLDCQTARPPQVPKNEKFVRHGSARARRVMQDQDQDSGNRRHQEKTPIKDEFTEFSQYGSRFMLNQVEEKKKEKNFVEQIQDNKIFRKVASTCQKHYRKTSTTENNLNVPDADLSQRSQNFSENTGAAGACVDRNVQIRQENSHVSLKDLDTCNAVPTIQPRVKKTVSHAHAHKHAINQFKTGEPEKFDSIQLERKTAMLFKKAEQSEPCHSVSMNTDPRACWSSRAGSDISKTSSSTRGLIKLRGFSVKSDSDSGIDGDSLVGEIKIKQVDIHAEYDLVQLIGEGWYSRVYLAEQRTTRDEVVLKAINSNLVTADEFCREYQSSIGLWPHKNILKVYDAVFQCDGNYMFAMEYAPLGDLTSNITELGLGETYTKRVTCQVGSALQWIHSKNLCHLDVKLDNILVFKSDFTLVKLCDFGAVRHQGDIVIKKNELLPYCPAELVAKHANEYYQVDRVQDVFQFGIVVFFCLLGVLPWQKADRTDPNYQDFCAWREKRSSKVPKNFKSLTNRAQKLFRKLLDPEPSKRLDLVETVKFMEDKWLRKGVGKVEGKDGQSQLTLGSFQSVHSNLCEKNNLLYTLLQHGVETTVDRSSKNNRIMKWIKQGAERAHTNSPPEDDIEEESGIVVDGVVDDIEDLEIGRISPE